MGFFRPYFLRNLYDLVWNDVEVSREKRVKERRGISSRTRTTGNGCWGGIQDDIESCPTYRTHRRGEISPPRTIACSARCGGGKGAANSWSIAQVEIRAGMMERFPEGLAPANSGREGHTLANLPRLDAGFCGWLGLP